VRRIGILVATAALLLAGCSGSGKDNITPSQPATSPNASMGLPQYGPLTDLKINGVSVKEVLDVVKTFSSPDFTLAIVTDRPAHCDGLAVTAESGSAIFCRTERTVVVPSGLQKEWGALPPSVIWYLVALKGVHASHAVFDTDLRAACGAGFITARMPGFDNTALTAMEGVITSHQGDGHAQAAAQGVTNWRQQLPMTSCGTYGPNA
jgi:hypothetical protein